MAYLQYHELGSRNHTTRRERLRALRVQVHVILGEDWDVRPMPRQRRSLELICHAAAAEPHAGPELCAQAALWDMRRQGLSLRQLEYGFTTSVWCTPMATVLSQRRALSMPHVTELSFETETLQGSRLRRAQVRGCNVPFVNRPFESEFHGTVNFTQFCFVLLLTWCYHVLLSCYLRPK